MLSRNTKSLSKALIFSLILHFLLLWPSPAWRSGFIKPEMDTSLGAHGRYQFSVQLEKDHSANLAEASLTRGNLAQTNLVDVNLIHGAVAQKPAASGTISASADLQLQSVTATLGNQPHVYLPDEDKAENNTAVRSGQEPAAVERSAQTDGKPQADYFADAEHSYLLALAIQMRSFRHYPQYAIAKNRTGRAEVSVYIAAKKAALGGEGSAGYTKTETPQLELTSGSGSAELDAAALEMLEAAVVRTPVPEILLDRGVAVKVPVIFELRNLK